MNKNKIILDLCGGTGAWSKPYKDAGYDVRLVTLPDNDVRTYRPPDNIYGILAAPPCTKFSLADWRHPLSKRDLEEAVKTLTGCLKIIINVQKQGNILKFWALENPRGYLRKFLGHPPFTFQGWQFGEVSETYATKRTDLWGYFRKPGFITKRRPHIVTPTRHSKSGWYSPKKPKWAKDIKLSRADIRAITPAGFAKAFFEANR